jgi:hypothetical protein
MLFIKPSGFAPVGVDPNVDEALRRFGAADLLEG